MAEIGLPANPIAGRRSKLRRPASAHVSGAPAASLLEPANAARTAAEWEMLAGGAVEDNPFFLPGVVLPAAEHFGAGVRVAVVRHAEGRLIAAAPVTSTRLGRIAPAIRVWSHNYGPLGVPLVDRHEVDRAAAALIDQLSPKGSLIVPDLTLEGPVAAALMRVADIAGRSVTVADGHRRAAILAGPGADDLRAALPARRRKEYGRQMRRLGDSGDVVMDAATGPQAVAAAFEEFLALEAAGWKGKAGTALAAIPDKAAFAREALANRSAAGEARIDALRIDGRAIAMVISFVAGATAVTWKIAHDEHFARFSPGAQIMLDLPPRIFADGRVTRIDSLAAADHPMIDHLWKDRIAIGTLVIGPAGVGVMHRLGLASFRAEIKARAIARRLRDRLRPGKA